jgi:hypothetical protein
MMPTEATEACMKVETRARATALMSARERDGIPGSRQGDTRMKAAGEGST